MRACMLALALFPSAALAAQKPSLAILDFESPDGGKLGARIAERLEKRAVEANKHVLMDLEDVRLAVKQAGLKPTLSGMEKEIQDLAREKLGANLVMWGKVESRGGTAFHLTVRCMATDGEPKPYLDVQKECANFAAIANFYTDFEPVLLKQRTAMRNLHPVSPEAKARNLCPNGSFEEGTWFPTHWQKVDSLATYWLDREDGKGKCIMIDTDVDRMQALDWKAKVESGKATAKDAPTPIRSTPSTIYNTIGGWEGVQYFSDYLPVKPTMRYRLTVDIKANWGGIFFPRAWIKGYGDRTDEFTTQKQQYYHFYISLRTKTKGKEWETFTQTFNPTLRTGNLPQLLLMGEIQHWQRFCGRLKSDGAAGAPSAGKRVWELLGTEARDAIEKAAQAKTVSGALQAAITDALNEVLSKPDFYREADFRKVALPAEAKDLLQLDRASLPENKVQRLNRILLESAYPQEIEKSRTGDVKYMRVMLYSYWPLGKYYWDNVIITEEAIED